MHKLTLIHDDLTKITNADRVAFLRANLSRWHQDVDWLLESLARRYR